MIEREAFDWGVRLTAHPFKGKDHQALVIRSEISLYKPGRGCDVKITFPGVSLQNPFRVLDAQTWYEAMGAIVSETRAVMAEMKTAAGSPKQKR
jgi:hypothetical protein